MQIQMTKIKINLRRLKTITKCQFIISETKKNIISNIYALKKLFLNFKKKNTYPNSGTKIIIKKITRESFIPSIYKHLLHKCLFYIFE